FYGKYIVPVVYVLFDVFCWGRTVSGVSVPRDAGPEAWLFPALIARGFTLSALTVMRKSSLLPLMAVLLRPYRLIEIPALAWVYFLVWMAIGLTIDFGYGYWRSKLRGQNSEVR